PGGKLERRDERAVAYPAVIVPGEANWLLRLRIQAWIGCKACGQQLACAVSPLADRLDDFRRHAEIEPALVLANGDVHDASIVLGRLVGVGPADWPSPGANTEVVLGQAEQNVPNEAGCRPENGEQCEWQNIQQKQQDEAADAKR